MITNMQFFEDEIALTVSELNSEGKVSFSMENVTEPTYSWTNISLSLNELVILRDWISESIDFLKNNPGV
jgi:hypothetical protein